MQYFGGKTRIANQLSTYLSSFIPETEYYFEPFVGSASVVEKIQGVRYASDKNHYLIEMYKALQWGWLPPTIVTPEEYAHIKLHKDENKALTGFVGFGCSFSGKWFGGYAKNKTPRNYALNAYNSLVKQLPYIQTVDFYSGDYKLFDPQHALIYCDPPYQGTTQYGATGMFDMVEFWQVMRKWTVNNKVFISEYQAPEDFECVLEMKTKTDIRTTKNGKEDRTEKLFTWRG